MIQIVHFSEVSIFFLGLINTDYFKIEVRLKRLFVKTEFVQST